MKPKYATRDAFDATNRACVGHAGFFKPTEEDSYCDAHMFLSCRTGNLVWSRIFMAVDNVLLSDTGATGTIVNRLKRQLP